MPNQSERQANNNDIKDISAQFLSALHTVQIKTKVEVYEP